MTLHVDATPDDGYPLRILRAYRENCDIMWSDNFWSDTNAAQRKRAEILDRAIALLTDHLAG